MSRLRKVQLNYQGLVSILNATDIPVEGREFIYRFLHFGYFCNGGITSGVYKLLSYYSKGYLTNHIGDTLYLCECELYFNVYGTVGNRILVLQDASERDFQPGFLFENELRLTELIFHSLVDMRQKEMQPTDNPLELTFNNIRNKTTSGIDSEIYLRYLHTYIKNVERCVLNVRWDLEFSQQVKMFFRQYDNSLLEWELI